MDTSLLDPIAEKLTDIIKNECEKIIEQISIDHDLDKDELIEKYLSNEMLTSFSKTEKKKRNRKSVPSDQMCLGRKIDYTQCTRRRKGDKLFCATHSNNLPFGRIDDGKEYPNTKEAKENSDFIAMRLYEVEDIMYLIDNNNIVYTYNVDNPVRIGIKNKDGDLIKISIVEIDGIEYMIDTNNNVYSADVDNPKYLGIKNEENEIILHE